MKRKTIYIAGPIRGMAKHNYEAFHAAYKRLLEHGWQPIDPFDITNAFGVPPTEVESNPRLLRAVMDAELSAIPHLDAIYLLRGWERSQGARAELAVALAHGKQILPEGAGE